MSAIRKRLGGTACRFIERFTHSLMRSLGSGYGWLMARPPNPGTFGRGLRAAVKCALRARPADYLLAATTASGSIPLVGRHFQHVGSMTALSVWGARFMPDLLAATARSWVNPGNAQTRTLERDLTNTVSAAALRDVVRADDLAISWPAPQRSAPLWQVAQQRKLVYRTSVRYGDDPGQLLDVWRRKDLPRQPAPVLIFIPGGAWIFGSRLLQGHALMSYLAERGWVCLSVEYRAAPRHPWPRQLTDVKAAIAWAHANVDQFGGDRDFVTIAGCSAGGHLAALAGLTPDDPQWQAGLPDGADTSVAAVVSLYGRYDWQDRSSVDRARFVDFLERVVVKRSLSRHPGIFRDASPLARIHPGAPPFLVIHGSSDLIIPVTEARTFVERLRPVSASAVSYLELPGAAHAFDLIDGARTAAVTAAIGLFLDHIERGHRAGRVDAVV